MLPVVDLLPLLLLAPLPLVHLVAGVVGGGAEVVVGVTRVAGVLTVVLVWFGLVWMFWSQVQVVCTENWILAGVWCYTGHNLNVLIHIS